MMHDLKKLDDKFHEFLKSGLNEKDYDFDEIEITENLLDEKKAFYIPFGYLTYFLVIEDGKPVVYVNAATRMDTDAICFVDEDSYECYDVFLGNNREISEKYYSHSKKVKKFKDIECLYKFKKQEKRK